VTVDTSEFEAITGDVDDLTGQVGELRSMLSRLMSIDMALLVSLRRHDRPAPRHAVPGGHHRATRLPRCAEQTGDRQ